MSVMEGQQRPRSKSTFSFKSDKSHSSKNSGKPKDHTSLKESHAEKARTHLTSYSKANPNAAINEAQPIAAQLEASTLGSLRSIRPVDTYGNPIDEPDLSNPTRPRWERPLDTIRSFEAAIDGEYKRRSTMFRTDSAPDVTNGFTSQRNSYYAGNDQYPSSRYSQAGGYYGARSSMGREGDSYGPPPQGPPRNRYGQRVQSEAGAPQQPGRQVNGQNVYPTPGYQQSRDTVNTGISNGSQSEPLSNSTDPSSENSSIERRAGPNKNDIGDQSGFPVLGGAPQWQRPIAEEYGIDNRSGYPQPNGYGQTGNGPHSHVPPPAAVSNRVPIKLGGSEQPLSSSSDNAPPTRPAIQSQNSVKRKSWFKRRFSKD